MQNKKKAREIVEKSMRSYEKRSEGRGECRFKRFVDYEGNLCAEVYCFSKGTEPTEEDLELWGIDFERGDADLICE